jgi:hypothetical protein
MIRGSCAGLRRLRWRTGRGLEVPSVPSSGRNSARSGQNFATVPVKQPVVPRRSRRVEKARKQGERLFQLGGLGAGRP